MNINVPKITRASRSNRLHLLPADTVEHALRGALFQYAQVAELATHARYLHARHLRGRTALQAKLSLLPAIPGQRPGILTV